MNSTVKYRKYIYTEISSIHFPYLQNHSLPIDFPRISIEFAFSSSVGLLS